MSQGPLLSINQLDCSALPIYDQNIPDRFCIVCYQESTVSLPVAAVPLIYFLYFLLECDIASTCSVVVTLSCHPAGGWWLVAGAGAGGGGGCGCGGGWLLVTAITITATNIRS